MPYPVPPSEPPAIYAQAFDAVAADVTTVGSESFGLPGAMPPGTPSVDPHSPAWQTVLPEMLADFSGTVTPAVAGGDLSQVEVLFHQVSSESVPAPLTLSERESIEDSTILDLPSSAPAPLTPPAPRLQDATAAPASRSRSTSEPSAEAQQLEVFWMEELTPAPPLPELEVPEILQHPQTASSSPPTDSPRFSAWRILAATTQQTFQASELAPETNAAITAPPPSPPSSVPVPGSPQPPIKRSARESVIYRLPPSPLISEAPSEPSESEDLGLPLELGQNSALTPHRATSLSPNLHHLSLGRSSSDQTQTPQFGFVLHQVTSAGKKHPISLTTQPESEPAYFPQLTASVYSPLTQRVNPPEPEPVIIPVPVPGESSEPSPPEESTPPVPSLPDTLQDDILEVKADRQEFDEQRQVVTAGGRVTVRFRRGLLDADWVQLNLITRQIVAQGNVALTRGEQVFRGERMEYNLVLRTGTAEKAQGEVLLSTLTTDFDPAIANDVTGAAILDEPLSDRITANEPQRRVQPTGGVIIRTGGRGNQPQGGTVNRLRFEAERLDIEADGGWIATNVRLTNDPFSPPELELRADRAQFRRLDPLQDEVLTDKPRLVLDQRITIPLLRRRTVIDRRPRRATPFNIGYDKEDRGGLFVERSFELVPQGAVDLRITPQFYVQRAIAPGEEERNDNNFPNLWGLKIGLQANLDSQTQLDGSANFLTFDNFPNVGERNFRGGLRLRRRVANHTLTAEYSYRDRLFNGTLGFQRVHSSLGFVITSPVIRLGSENFDLTYQIGYQFINARTDRRELLNLDIFEPIPIEDDDPRGRADVNRLQAVVAFGYRIPLWRGKPLPATREQGLRFTPAPVVPFVQLVLGARGLTSVYSNDETQSYVSGTIGLVGQFGHFSRNFLDYTGFNLAYTQLAITGESPFFFDRVVDQQILSFGIVQQLYGPLRVGFQSAINLENSRGLDSQLTLEYSRRTYGVILRYSFRRELGSLTLRISDFNWSGAADPFFGSGVRAVEGGVRR